MSKLTGKKDAKDKKDKPRLSLIPKEALWESGQALTYGEAHYGAHNWRNGIPFSFLLDAALRHIHQFNDGENYDQESKAHHLGAAMANLSMAITLQTVKPESDDRHKPEISDEEHLNLILESRYKAMMKDSAD